jgi:hypothetical protein
VRDQGSAWWQLGLVDVVALADPYTPDYPVLRRSRARFVQLFARGLLTAARLYWRYGALARHWQAAFARLTGKEFWHGYLGLAKEEGRPRPEPAPFRPRGAVRPQPAPESAGEEAPGAVPAGVPGAGV